MRIRSLLRLLVATCMTVALTAGCADNESDSPDSPSQISDENERDENEPDENETGR